MLWNNTATSPKLPRSGPGCQFNLQSGPSPVLAGQIPVRAKQEKSDLPNRSARRNRDGGGRPKSPKRLGKGEGLFLLAVDDKDL